MPKIMQTTSRTGLCWGGWPFTLLAVLSTPSRITSGGLTAMSGGQRAPIFGEAPHVIAKDE